MQPEVYLELFKKVSKGTVRYWKTWVVDKGSFAEVHTSYGELGTSSPVSTMNIVKEGKNLGKSNATTYLTQAIAEAKQNYEAKIKEGYVSDISAKTKLPSISPMLANSLEDPYKLMEGHRIVQPKLDGARCVCEIDFSAGTVGLYSRTRKRIGSVPHIEKQIENLLPDFREELESMGIDTTLGKFYLDGELYNHDFCDNFEDLMSIIRKDEVNEKSDLIQYHVYDIFYVDANGLLAVPKQRNLPLHNLVTFPLTSILVKGSHIKLVETICISTKSEVDKLHDYYVGKGYEGVMVRKAGLHYEFKRSNALLKYKKFQDAEFKVVGVKEGTGKLMGHVGSFVCVTKEGKEFHAKMDGALANLKVYWEDQEDYIGRYLTVEFFRYTKYGVPRFPVGKGFRIESDLDLV